MSAAGNWHLVPLDSMPTAPWRNGGGVTRELLVWPDAGQWKVRMSVAEVARDGPFSRFDGVQRWFAVLAGAGVRLRLDGATHELTSHSPPFAFDGGSETGCELIAGPTQDFNLMLRGARGRMGRVRGTQSPDCVGAELVAVFAGAGGAHAFVGPQRLELAPRTLAWRILDADRALRVESQDALWMAVKPVSRSAVPQAHGTAARRAEVTQ